MLTAVIIMLVLLLAIVVARLIKKALEIQTNPEKQNSGNKILIQQRIKLHYETGHPALTAPVQVYLLLNGGHVELHKTSSFPAYEHTATLVATIPVAAIKEVLVHNQSTTAYETTAGRMIRFGDLGLALKTKELSEAAELVINWSDSQANHETRFTKKGPGAVADAQAVKERLVKEK